MSMKIPMTLGGIEPATFRIVAQHLNHCATAVPQKALSTTQQLLFGKFMSPENNKTHTVFQVWCPYFGQILKEFGFSRRIF